MISEDKKLQQQDQDNNESANEPGEKMESFHNPFDPKDKTEVDQERLDNEQQFKEALTGRD